MQGSCQQGVAVNCNDGVACTVDTCLESDGTCLHTPDESYCDDGRTCTSWTCDAIGGCQSETLPDCCGNGLCESGEDSITCPDDCASDAVPVCGNGVCEAGEDCTSQSCPQDCRGKQRGRGASRFCCGGTVGGGGGDGPVDCSDPRCSADGWICGDSPQTWCGDGVCDRQAGEDGCTCGEDCPSFEIETNCTDGEDEDCDGFVDCADSDCAGDPNCSASCGVRGTSCTTNDECCSGRCKRNGTCH